MHHVPVPVSGVDGPGFGGVGAGCAFQVRQLGGQALHLHGVPHLLCEAVGRSVRGLGFVVCCRARLPPGPRRTAHRSPALGFWRSFSSGFRSARFLCCL